MKLQTSRRVCRTSIRITGLAATLGVLLLGACAPAPLYTSSRLPKGAVTGGEIPRDARGEPVWSAIRPMPRETMDWLQGKPAPQIPQNGTDNI